MTWLDLGNGWRNLFLLSAFLQAVSLGTLFAARRWFSKGSRLACFLTGAAATPLLEYLWMRWPFSGPMHPSWSISAYRRWLPVFCWR